MKAATRVPIRDAPALLYPSPDVSRVSHVYTIIRNSNSLIIGESINDGLIRIDLPELHPHSVRRNERHSMKRSGLALMTFGTGVGCFHC